MGESIVNMSELSYFCILILYHATLLNSLITSSNFLIIPLKISMYNIKSSENGDSFTYSFPTWIPFISFSSLIAIAKTSKTMLNNSSESGDPSLFPDLRGNVFSFSQLRIMFACIFFRLILCLLLHLLLFSPNLRAVFSPCL